MYDEILQNGVYKTIQDFKHLKIGFSLVPVLPAVIISSRILYLSASFRASTRTRYEAPDVRPISVALVEVAGSCICNKQFVMSNHFSSV